LKKIVQGFLFFTYCWVYQAVLPLLLYLLQ